MNSITHYSLVLKFIPMPQALKITDAKAAVEKNWRKLRHGSCRKSETRKKRSRKQGTRAQKFILRHWWLSVILKKFGRSWNLSIRNTKAGLYSEVILWKMILVRMQCSLNKDHQHGYHLQIARLRWRSSRCSISLYPSKNGRCSQIIENFQNRSVQIFGFVYHDTNGLNHGPVWKTQLFFSKGICTVILWQAYYGKGNLSKFFWNTVGKSF